jgi:hypothetical protein
MTETGALGCTYPVRVEARQDRPGRWLWLVKWLLLIPHYVVLAFLWVAFVVTTVFAFFAVLVTGRYPRGIFAFNLGVLRWTWRVSYYGYSALGTDRYPPFTLGEVPDYPATLTIAYPERLSRGLVLVKWWLLALPHYLLLAVLTGGLTWTASNAADGAAYGGAPGLLTLAVLFAAVALLFAGRYPAGLYDLVMGVNRWALRVLAYAALMTDEYPPFRLDQGGAEPAPDPGPPPAGPPARTGSRQSSAGAVAALVVGLLALLPALGMAAGGGAALWLDSRRDASGYVSTDVGTLTSQTAAVTVEDVDLTLDQDAVRWLSDNGFGKIRVRVTADDGAPLFVGIAPEAAVDRWLSGVAHDQISEIHSGDGITYTRATGSLTAVQPPGQVAIWTASSSGTGTRQLDWTVESGRWALVVARADGRTGVQATAAAATTVPDLTGWGAGLLAGGLGLLVVSVALIVIGASGLGHRSVSGPAGPAGSGTPDGSAPPGGTPGYVGSSGYGVTSYGTPPAPAPGAAAAPKAPSARGRVSRVCSRSRSSRGPPTGRRTRFLPRPAAPCHR